ncbi:MAG: hypothetical protein RL011_75 [Pseudomonadota bacterium]|jgi:arabinose-5-phosphate isomerase
MMLNDHGPDFEHWGQEVLAVEAKALDLASTRIGRSFSGAVGTVLASKGKVIVTGLGKSGHVGRKVAATLSSTGTSAMFLHPSEALHGDFGAIQTGDCLLAIAYGGETHEVLEVARFARRVGVPIIALTGRLDSSLAKLAHHLIDASVLKEADPLNLAPTSSSTVAMALGDALAVALMRARGFTPQDFASLHPGGSLGRRLSLVRDHMFAGASLPRVGVGADFHRVLECVTQDNVGIVAVVDDQDCLIGAISDGDLRRALLRLDAAALQCKAQELMSPMPKTITDRSLAIDAVSMMNEYSISRLFVLSEDHPGQLSGLVRLQDLLAAKIL